MEDKILEIKEELLKAQESNKPFPIVDGDGNLTIVGDANDTKTNKNTYTIEYRFPKDKFEELKGEVKGNFKICKIEYKGVFITPRMETKLEKYIISILPLYFSLKDGKKLTNGEVMEIYKDVAADAIDAMYSFVGIALDLPDGIIDYANATSVIEAFIQLLHNNPQLVNSADMVFGYGA